jgi:hypothetical protein
LDALLHGDVHCLLEATGLSWCSLLVEPVNEAARVQSWRALRRESGNRRLKQLRAKEAARAIRSLITIDLGLHESAVHFREKTRRSGIRFHLTIDRAIAERLCLPENIHSDRFDDFLTVLWRLVETREDREHADLEQNLE